MARWIVIQTLPTRGNDGTLWRTRRRVPWYHAALVPFYAIARSYIGWRYVRQQRVTNG